jgi:DNA-binding NarL/FixJ family response regulator
VIDSSHSMTGTTGNGNDGRPRMLAVLIVDDHEVVRIGLRGLITAQPDMNVCGEASTIAEARAAIERLRPDVVLLDLTLGDESGFSLLRSMEKDRKWPPVLVLSMFDESLYSDDALSLGASGYMMKDAPPEELTRAIRTVAGGGVYLRERLSQRVVRRIVSAGEQQPTIHAMLTAREQEVLELLGMALTTREIAARMGTAVKTVDSHKRNLCEKLGLDSAAALLRYAVVNARPSGGGAG